MNFLKSSRKSASRSANVPRQLQAFSFYHSDRHLNHTIGQAPPPEPERGNHSWRRLLVAAIVIVAAILVFAVPLGSDHHFTSHKAPANSAGSKSKANTPQYSLTDPTSLWVVVNKQRPLSPIDYAPADLVVPSVPMRGGITDDEMHVAKIMAGPLEAMFAAANQQGIQLNLQSGYRSYNFQVALYDRYVSEQGQTTADEQSARPGYSEHQTGLAADLGSPNTPDCEVAQCFGSTPAGQWLAANSYKYGFIIRYPLGKQQITGYEYEPWHVRYIGTELAGAMRAAHIETLEEYFHLPPASDY